MRMRTLLTSAASVAVLMATTALVPHALAQKGTTLNPQTGWAVTSVAGSATGTGGYCATARRFQENLILTLAKNHKQEASLALDFPRGTFNPQQSFAVTLDPGAGQQRSYNVKPVSAKAFVLRLGRDGPFFDALKKTGYLRAEIGNQTYNFNLADIDKGEAQLASCLMSASAAPASGGSSMTPFPASTPAVGGTVSGLSKQINALEQENQRLSAELTQAQGAATGDFRTEIETLRRKNTVLTAQMDSLRESGDSHGILEHKIQSLQEENHKLAEFALAGGVTGGGESSATQQIIDENKRLQSLLGQQASAIGQVDQLTRNLQILEEDNARLSKDVELARYRDSAGQEVAVREVKRLEMENLNLNKKIIQAKYDTQSKYQKEITQYVRENAQLKISLEKKGVDQEVLSYLRGQIGELTMANQDLQESLAGIETASGTHDLELMKLESEKARLETSLKTEQTLKTSHKNSLARLEIELEGVRSNQGRIEDEARQARSLARDLEQSLAAADSENDLLQGRMGQISDEVRKVALLERDLKDVKSKNTRLNDELILAKESSNNALNSEIEFLIKKNERLEMSLEKEKENSGRLEGLRADLLALRTKNETLKMEVTGAAESENERLALNMRVKALLDENTRFKEEAISQNSLVMEVASLNQEVEALSVDNRKLNEAVIMAASEVQKQGPLQAKLDELQHANGKLVLSLQMLQKESDTYQSLVLNQQEEIDALKVANEGLRRELKMSVSGEDFATLREALDGLRTENKRLQGDLEQALAEMPDLIAAANHEKIAAELYAQNGELQNELEEMRAQHIAVVAAVDNTQVVEENKRLKSRVDTLLSEANTPQDEAFLFELAQENLQLKKELQMMHKASRHASKVNFEQVQQQPVRLIRIASVAQGIARKPNIPRKNIRRVSDEDRKSFEKTLQDIIPQAGEAKDHGRLSTEHSTIEEQQEQARDANKELVSPSIKSKEIVPTSAQKNISDAQKQEAAMAKGLSAVPDKKPEDKIAITEPVSKSAPDIDGKQEDEIMKILQASPEDSPAVSKVVPVKPPPSKPTIANVIEPAASSVSVKKDAVEKTIQKTDTIQDILRRAGVSVNGDIQLVDKAKEQGIKAYQWRSDDLFGSAEEKSINNPAQFDEYVEHYIERTKMRCPGDFAVLPDVTSGQGSVRVSSYEIACIGDNVNSSATVVFFSADGTFTSVAHEASTAHMDMAMDVRDRLIKAIAGISI